YQLKINGVGWGPVARPPGWSANRDQVLHLLADLHRAPPVPLGQDLLVGLGDQDRLLGAVHLPQRLVDLVPGEGLVELDAQVGEGDPVAVAAALAGEDRLVGGGDLGGDLVLHHASSIARYTVTVKHARKKSWSAATVPDLVDPLPMQPRHLHDLGHPHPGRQCPADQLVTLMRRRRIGSARPCAPASARSRPARSARPASAISLGMSLMPPAYSALADSVYPARQVVR